MKKVILLILFLTGLVLNGLAQGRPTSEVQLIFDKYTKNEGVKNAFFRIESSDQSISQDLVYGKFTGGEKVTLRTPFYTASIGKTFTGVAIAQLVEKGKLTFDDLVINHLDSLVNGMLVIDGKDYISDLTLHHLLNHTSGLPDYFEDQPLTGANMMQNIFKEPNRYWKPVELVEFTKANFSGRFKPGEGYHYTDTEYVLLGLIIEKVSGMPLHKYFQENIFGPLSMQLTSMNLRSEPTGKPDFNMAEIYTGSMEISKFRSLSADWAGGSIRSTSQDLNVFLKALLHGALLSEETINKMQLWTPESKGTWYGYGLRKWSLSELDPNLPPLKLIGHSGSTGAFMYYCPELDVYLSGTFNNTDYLQKHIVFLAEVLINISQNSKE